MNWIIQIRTSGGPKEHRDLPSALFIQYSSILSTRPNYLNTLWSALLTNSLSIPALLSTSSFLTISIRDTSTKLLKNYISKTFTFLLSVLLIPHASAPYNVVGTITPPNRHFLPLSPILYYSAHFSAFLIVYTPHSFHVPHSFHILYQLPLWCKVLKAIA